MKTKLKPEMCYLAGMQGKGSEVRSAVGVVTTIGAIEEEFIELCIKYLLIPPNRILIEEKGNARHIYFYHSQIYRRLKEINDKKARIFTRENELSRSYIAGLFDAAGHIGRNGITIKGMDPSDELILDRLGVHTMHGRILNIRLFITLLKGYSVLFEHVHLPGNERDPR